MTRTRRFSPSNIYTVKTKSFEDEKQRYGHVKLCLIQEGLKKAYIDYLIEDHTDFTILAIINAYRSNFITESDCDKMIDIVEGYYFAYSEGFISSVELYNKINSQILEDVLQLNNIDFVGIFLEESNDCD